MHFILSCNKFLSLQIHAWFHIIFPYSICIHSIGLNWEHYHRILACDYIQTGQPKYKQRSQPFANLLWILSTRKSNRRFLWRLILGIFWRPILPSYCSDTFLSHALHCLILQRQQDHSLSRNSTRKHLETNCLNFESLEREKGLSLNHPCLFVNSYTIIWCLDDTLFHEGIEFFQSGSGQSKHCWYTVLFASTILVLGLFEEIFL